MTNCPFCAKALSIMVKPVQRPILSVCHACMNPLVLHYDGAAWNALGPKGVQDIRAVAQAGSIGEELMQIIPRAIENLPILPEIARRIMTMIRDPEISLQDLIDLINQDQVVALKILKLANSPVYGGLTEIKDLRSACARLGTRVIANTVQAIANGRLYTAKNPLYAELMTALWGHALASAQCASDLAVMTAEPCADTLFVAGLIHDVGKVLLLDVVTNQNSPTMRTLRETPELLDEVLGGYHALIGLHIVQRWNLPPEFGVTTFCHDHFSAVPDDSWLSQVHIVALASAVANGAGFGAPEEGASLLSHPSTKFLGITDIRLASLRIDLEDKVKPLLDITGAS